MKTSCLRCGQDFEVDCEYLDYSLICKPCGDEMDFDPVIEKIDTPVLSIMIERGLI